MAVVCAVPLWALGGIGPEAVASNVNGALEGSRRGAYALRCISANCSRRAPKTHAEDLTIATFPYRSRYSEIAGPRRGRPPNGTPRWHWTTSCLAHLCGGNPGIDKSRGLVDVRGASQTRLDGGSR